MADHPPALLPLDNSPPPFQLVVSPADLAADIAVPGDPVDDPPSTTNTSNSLTSTPPTAPYVLALQPWNYRTRYSTQDVRSVWVKPVTGYQSIERRFGPKARKRIYARLHGQIADDDEATNFQDQLYDSDGDGQYSTEHNGNNNSSENPNGGAISTGYDSDGETPGHHTNANSNETLDAEDAEDTESLHIHDPDTEDDTPSEEGLPPTGDAEALENAFTSLNGGPLNAAGEPGPPVPPVQPSIPSAQPRFPPAPNVSRARMNLTALSQRYNLYFAVYQAEIHIFRPQPAPEILHGPLLVLKPPPTAAGRQLGGHMSHDFPHQANQIKIGDFGGMEIVVLAYDDGDVVAYYTHHIVAYVENIPKRRHRGPQRARRLPKPFFRETVGATAWGLAIHSQSRLIAVSSNLREVNVFAFAIQPPRADDPLQHKTQPLVVPSDDLSPTTYAGASALELESMLRQRDRYWRILLPIGTSGHNIPSIDFISDPAGIAEKVAAVDILGSIFIMDIWKVGSRPLKIGSPYRSGYNTQLLTGDGINSMNIGWGVMVIPMNMFLPTNRMPAPSDRRVLNRCLFPNIDGTFYFSYLNDPARKKPKYTPTAIDTSELDTESDSDKSMRDDVDDTQMYGSGYETEDSSDDDDEEHGRDRENREQDGDGGMDYSEEDRYSDDSHVEDSTPYTHGRTESTGSNPFAFDPATMSRHWDVLLKRNHWPVVPNMLDLKKDARSPFRLGMIICPSIGVTWSSNNLQSLIGTLKNARWRLAHTLEENLHEFQVPQSKEVTDMARRFFLIRTYSQTVELLRTDRTETPFYIQNVMKPPSRLPFILWDMAHDFFRCSLLHCIPEINLVLVGNMFGRVVLIRPLKNQQAGSPSAHINAPDYAFRVEWTLPLARDEQQKLRPPCCLLGMAVSAVPEPGSGRFGVTNTRTPDRTQRSRRWRLILHYMDHSIFQYYIEETKPGVKKLKVRPY
ncbi:hypothetical protein HMPREF1624_01420 [Sporothrix schenckii ATCC 58251]|uniref:Uncharacterized protein n=1 Tax=Sporothrix schenckii (strain ATCC 58251 / de Perez 2211183) TaxID=1391915 RepID=U7Q7U0_SPOS1|nr:hypothetical protein HMPREF1624_01420 [Sporothrix schenckii ATCC 58251]